MVFITSISDTRSVSSWSVASSEINISMSMTVSFVLVAVVAFLSTKKGYQVVSITVKLDQKIVTHSFAVGHTYLSTFKTSEEKAIVLVTVKVSRSVTSFIVILNAQQKSISLVTMNV